MTISVRLVPWAAIPGAVAGFASQHRWVMRHLGPEGLERGLPRLVAGGVAGAVLAALVYAALTRWLRADTPARLAYSFAPLALMGAAPFVDHHVAAYAGAFALFGAAVFLPARATVLEATQRSLALPDRRSLFVAAVFFASGFAALVYQLVWQRTLFTIYGSNVESTAMVVTAFMLGLGLGSLLGGVLSRRPGANLVLMFGLTEIGIGLYGAGSLWLFARVDEMTLDLSFAGTAAVTFALILIPTLLMGATLPLLVEHFVRAWRNVGRTVGLFYFVNTLGSAAGALCAAALLFGLLGQSGTVALAAAINAFVGISVIVAFRGGRT